MNQNESPIRKTVMVIGGVGLRRGSIRPPAGPVMVAVAEDINTHLIACDWLADAPFRLVSMILRYGDAKPNTEINRIDKRHSELPVARELSFDECRERGRSGTLFELFLRETVIAMSDVSKRYKLPMSWIDAYSNLDEIG
jgi:hypothetical protein